MKTLIQSIKALSMVALILGLSCQLNAQDKSEKSSESVKIKIMTSENGETKVFEKKYDSKEEMEGDEELKTFKSDTNGLHHIDVHVDADSKGSHKMKFFRNMDSDGEGKNINMDVNETDDGRIELKITHEEGGETKTIEKVYDSMEEMKNDPKLDEYNVHLLKDGSWVGDSGKASAFFFKHGDNADIEINIDEELENMHSTFFSMGEDGDFEIKINGKTYTLEDLKNEDVMEELKEEGQTLDIIKSDGDHKVMIVTKIKRTITISDFENSELPKAFDAKSEGRLKLHGLQYYPNPSNGTFKLSFRSPDADNLRIRVVDMVGKEIYSHETSNFSGSFEKEIDLSSAQSGIYILQIQQGGKALSKKIVIE